MHSESWILHCTAEQPWKKRCWDLAPSSSPGCAEGGWGFQFPKRRKELSLVSQEASTEAVTKLLSYPLKWSGHLPQKRDVRQTTGTHKLSLYRGDNVLLGFNLQSLLRLCLSLTHAEFPVKHQELFIRHWKAVLCVLGEKITWIRLKMDPGKCLTGWRYLCRALKHFARQEPLARGKSCSFEHLNYRVNEKARLNSKPVQLNKAALLRIGRVIPE